MTKDRQFTIGKVKFEIQPIPPMRAWEISELIREALGRPGVLSLEIPEGSNPMVGVLALLAGLKKEDVLVVRNALFEFVKFKDEEQLKPLVLSGVEDMAFSSLDFSAIYEVMGRAFYVNFTGCLTELMSRVGIELGVPKAASDSGPSAHGQSPSSSPNL